jgi:hypothetical protein
MPTTADYVRRPDGTVDWAATDRAVNRRLWAEGARRDPDGIWRWESNGSIPPKDVLRDNLDGDELAANLAAYDAELAVFLAAYRAAQPAEPDAEQLYEMRAAFGPGVEVVDVITGRRVRT